MKALNQPVLCLTLCFVSGVAQAADVGGAGIATPHTRLAPIAVIMASAQLRGLRLREVRWDAVLKQNWAVLEDIQHPEYPLWAERMDTVGPVDASSVSGVVDPTTGTVTPTATIAPFRPPVIIVHYGDRVRLWRNDRNVRIEISAIADGNAAAGEELKLRIPSSGVDGDTGWRVFGVVHGPGDVEMTQ